MLFGPRSSVESEQPLQLVVVSDKEVEQAVSGLDDFRRFNIVARTAQKQTPIST